MSRQLTAAPEKLQQLFSWAITWAIQVAKRSAMSSFQPLSAGAMLIKTKLTLLHITARYNEAGVFHVHTSTLPLPHFELPNQAKKTLAQQLLNQKKAAKALRHPLWFHSSCARSVPLLQEIVHHLVVGDQKGSAEPFPQLKSATLT